MVLSSPSCLPPFAATYLLSLLCAYHEGRYHDTMMAPIRTVVLNVNAPGTSAAAGVPERWTVVGGRVRTTTVQLCLWYERSRRGTNRGCFRLTAIRTLFSLFTHWAASSQETTTLKVPHTRHYECTDYSSTVCSNRYLVLYQGPNIHVYVLSAYNIGVASRLQMPGLAKSKSLLIYRDATWYMHDVLKVYNLLKNFRLDFWTNMRMWPFTC